LSARNRAIAPGRTAGTGSEPDAPAREFPPESGIGGVTADLYGARVDTSVFLIDREGKIALRPQDPSIVPKVQAIMKEAGIDPGPRCMTEEQFQVLLEKLYTREIEELLKAPNRGAARP
jgi:hypothetical protein